MNDNRERPSIRLDEALMQAIAAHDFNTLVPANTAAPRPLQPARDDGLTFERRLARENGWSQSTAARAIAEYRRFVYLAARAGHPVTPSDAVDQVWHLHLCYTRNYWDVMCAHVLRQPLHHGPTVGGAAEAAKFTEWYARTLNSYLAHFGEPPPADIWPQPAERFAADSHARVDRATHWIIPKPDLSRWLWLRGASLILLALAAAGATEAGPARQSPYYGDAIVFNLAALAVYALLMSAGWRRVAYLVTWAAVVTNVMLFGQSLSQNPLLIVAGVGLWFVVSIFTHAFFYRRKPRRTSTRSASHSDSGCYSYAFGGDSGGNLGGPGSDGGHSSHGGHSDGGHGGHSDGGGGSGCGSGCGGGCGGGG